MLNFMQRGLALLSLSAFPLSLLMVYKFRIIGNVETRTALSRFACRLKRSMQHRSSRLIPQCFSQNDLFRGLLQLDWQPKAANQ